MEKVVFVRSSLVGGGVENAPSAVSGDLFVDAGEGILAQRYPIADLIEQKKIILSFIFGPNGFFMAYMGFIKVLAQNYFHSVSIKIFLK